MARSIHRLTRLRGAGSGASAAAPVVESRLAGEPTTESRSRNPWWGRGGCGLAGDGWSRVERLGLNGGGRTYPEIALRKRQAARPISTTANTASTARFGATDSIPPPSG